MATIEKRTVDGGTNYRVKVRLRGHPSQSATFARLTDARKWAQATEAAIREGRYFQTVEAKRHTLADAIDRYDRDVLAHRGGDAPSRRASLAWWRDALGAYTLADLTPARISEQRDKLRAEPTNRGAKRAAGTVNRLLAALSHLLTVATNEWGWLDANPMRKVGRLTEPRGRDRYLDTDEIARLLDACRANRDARVYPLVVLALATGARQGELVGLRWKQIDLDRRRIILDKTKNGERRALPLSEHTHAMLADMARVRRIDTDAVFAAPGATEPRFPRHGFEAALRAASIEDFRFHDLRHTAASHLAMNGASLMEIAGVLGHKTLAMVKRYAHLTDGHTATVVASMNDKMFGDAEAI